MEPLLIGGIALVVLILVLVAAYLLLYKEQSFEDALASQKSFNDILIQNKTVSGKAGLKHRKKTRKERTKSEGETEKIATKQNDAQLEAFENSDSSTLPKSLVDEAVSLFETLPEKPAVAESSEEEKPVQKPKKKSRDRRKHDQNRDVVESPLPKEQEPDKRAVKEDVLVQETFVKTKEEEALEGLPPMVEEEPLLPKEESALPTGSSGKKAKKSKGQKEKQSTAEPLSLKSLMAEVETGNLNHDEIQKLVDVLLDKQKSAEQWKKSGGKPDQMDILRKQLSDKEAEYKEEHARAESLAVKIKEQREELTQGLAKQKKQEAEASQKIKSLEKENQALQMRMNASQQNNALEHEKLVASGGELMKNLNNQNAELNARISALETEIKSRKENEAILIQKNEEASNTVKNFDVLKNNLSQQLQEAVKSKAESQQRLEVAKKGAEAAHLEKSNAIQQVGTLQSQLDEERSKKSELEKMFKALEVKLKDTSDKHVQEKEKLARQLEAASGKKADAEAAKLQKQSEDASRQLDELKAKLAKSEEEHEKTKQSLVGRDEQLSKHEGEISSLKSMNSSKDEEIDVLRRTVSQHENEIVVMKNNMSQELQSAPPEVDDTKVKSLEEEIEKLNGQLKERKEQIAAWEKSIESMKAKNNELREKNWKAMDALSAAEKQHKADIGKAVSSVKEDNEKKRQALHSEFKEFLCRINPTLSIDKDLSYKDFLNKYENDTEELRCRSPESESNDSKLEELEEQLKNYIKQNEELEAQCAGHKSNLDSKINELNEVSKKNEELDSQCNKYKSFLGSTENMLHELEDNVEKEIASLKVTVESKDAELGQTNSSLRELKEKLEKALDEAKSKDEKITSLQEELSSKASLGDKESELQQMTLTVTQLKETLTSKDEHAKTKDDKITSLEKDVSNKDADLKKTNSSLNELKEKLEKALDDAKSKDEKITSLQEELSSKASLGDKESELQQMTLTVTQLKETLKSKDEHAKTKDDKITSLEKDVSNKDAGLKKANSSVAELKENVRKVSDESKSKDSKINSLQLELSTLKTAAATSSDESKNENKKLSEQVEVYKEQEKALRDELEATKKEAKLRAEEDKSPELEKYKNEASDAAKVNAALRKELEEVRIENSGAKSPKKKHDKESETKIKALEEKLAHATKRESELQAKIAHLEDSTSTHSLDEDASPDGKDKKKKRGFSLMGSKSSKYESKYRDMTEKYEQVKSENDEKASRIAELEAKLDNSEKALQTQEQKVKELKAQVGGLANGGVQTNDKPLNESQVKQMADAMTEGEPTGAV